jgi:sterol desaturase/sphingolipid hydroxylase (fatty acid hydroxylase superfamily)
MTDLAGNVQALAPLVAGGFYLALFGLEWLAPLRDRARSLANRLLQNIVLTALALFAGGTCVRPVAVAVMGWSEGHRYGLLQWFTLPMWGRMILGFLLMDMAFYYWHRINHCWPILWRFHNVHHCDPDLDTTTAFRFHFAEVAYSSAFRMVQVGALGIDLPTYAIYELVFTCATIFHHSNLRLPFVLEKPLAWFVVSPRMHGIHHSYVHTETDSNYSVVFNIWDRINGTLRLNVPQGAIRIGVPGYGAKNDNRIITLLLAPFHTQKSYWKDADGAVYSRDRAACASSSHTMVE